MRGLLILAALLAPLPALAHPGGDHVHGVAAGFLHPLAGLDHLAAMVAVGAWAGLTGGRARWALPLAFLGGAAAGGMMGATGVALPMVEAGILASVIVLGVLVGAAARLPTLPGAALLAVFGVLHGHAHGTELAGGALGFGLGALGATALLHGLGVTLSAGSDRTRVALRFAGAAASVAALLVAVGG